MSCFDHVGALLRGHRSHLRRGDDSSIATQQRSTIELRRARVQVGVNIAVNAAASGDGQLFPHCFRVTTLTIAIAQGGSLMRGESRKASRPRRSLPGGRKVVAIGERRTHMLANRTCAACLILISLAGCGSPSSGGLSQAGDTAAVPIVAAAGEPIHHVEGLGDLTVFSDVVVVGTPTGDERTEVDGPWSVKVFEFRLSSAIVGSTPEVFEVFIGFEGRLPDGNVSSVVVEGLEYLLFLESTTERDHLGHSVYLPIAGPEGMYARPAHERSGSFRRLAEEGLGPVVVTTDEVLSSVGKPTPELVLPERSLIDQVVKDLTEACTTGSEQAEALRAQLESVAAQGGISAQEAEMLSADLARQFETFSKLVSQVPEGTTLRASLDSALEQASFAVGELKSLADADDYISTLLSIEGHVDMFSEVLSSWGVEGCDSGIA